MYNMRACVPACMRACVHACLRACMRACMRAGVHTCRYVVLRGLAIHLEPEQICWQVTWESELRRGRSVSTTPCNPSPIKNPPCPGIQPQPRFLDSSFFRKHNYLSPSYS